MARKKKQSELSRNLRSKRFWMYWVIILLTWALYWAAGKYLVDHTQLLNFGKYGVIGAMVVGLIRWIFMEYYWRKLPNGS